MLFLQDWLYDEGEDSTKAIYIAKIEEIRMAAGPIIQRYLDKVEEERQAVLAKQEEEAARKRAEKEAAKAEQKAPEAAPDAEMKDAQNTEIEEMD